VEAKGERAGEPLPISVVIPAYRRPDMVERALRSVQAQRRRPAEVIVVDDASGDETGARAERFGARVIVHDENRGVGASRNTGIEAARHDWVALLDCDDEWLPAHLETLWPARDGHVLVSAASLGTGDGPSNHRLYGWGGRRPRRIEGPAEVALPENKVTPSAAMVRRDAAIAAGGFPSFPRAEDLDLWVRMLQVGTALTLPSVTALYHIHSGQASSDDRLMDEAHQAVLEAYEDQAWCTRSLRLRHEGVVAWDQGRAARAEGEPAASVALRLAARLAHPARLAGVASLLTARLSGRRLASRVGPGGAPSVALLPGGPAGAEGAVDLRSAGWPRALLHLARRPPARAVVGGRAAALVVRALGVEPVR
jgi:GT2 family glycosyltransferase